MNSMVEVPWWIFALMVISTIWFALDHILIPSIRLYFRRRVNRVIHKINQRLDIEIRPFQRTKKQALVDQLIFDQQVVQMIRSYSKEHQLPYEVAYDKAQKYANEIVPNFNAFVYFRFGYYISKRLARLFYRVRVGFYDSDMMKKIPDDASVVFVMNHRSNLDNILVSFLIARRTVLSYAVGEWARVWPLQSLVQSMGAFFVRRNSRNELYRKVLERYVHLSSRAGVCQAVFPEGKLSQDGELSEPKIGFIDYILRDYHQAIDRKVVFIPVGINYDRVIEDKSLLLSASPSPSKKSLWFILKTSYQFIFKTLKLQRKQRWRRFGYASVNFGQPIYATQFCDEKDIAFAVMEKQQRIEVVKSIAKALMDSIQNILPILPVPLMSELILKNKHQWISELDLKTQCVKRLKELKQQGAPIEISDSACEGVLTGALDILIGRGFVDTNEGLLKAKPEMLPVLKYYANSIVQWQSL